MTSRNLLLAMALLVLLASSNQAQQVNFNRDIRPILSKHCLACHGPDPEQRQADLRLDVRNDALAAIEPGDVEASEVFARITSDDDDRMPPVEHGSALSKNETELIRKWIEEGAPYETHWSFVAPIKAQPPELDPETTRWARNEIDHFVAAKLSELKLQPSPEEDPRRLIRRVALDLTGLPPSLDMVKRFVRTPTDATYLEIVDELLASPSYGEHWTAMWLDIARYADTIGYASDSHRTIWPWRDWVIKAFNSNMPYDQFTIEQIAGDLLPGATVDQKLATAFHRNTLNNSEGGTNDEEFRTIAVKDRISTTVNVWMGLTLRCAECHTHKYDPISQTEYYQFLAFFNQTQDEDKNDERPVLDVFPDGREEEFAKLDAEIKTLTKQLAEAETVWKSLESDSADSPEDATPRDPQEDQQTEPTESKAAKYEKETLKPLKQKLETATKNRNAPMHVPVMLERKPEDVRETHLMVRGSYLQPGETVTAAVFDAFPRLPKDDQPNRLGVAHWLVADDNPLTARVTVNRFWARIFGRGIVETEEDFGTQGTPPSNQELLDWVAVDFRENGWDVKRLLKQIVTSSSYRQTGVATADRVELDPGNAFLSRGPRFRMRAEVIRDQALAVSGLLSAKQFGPPVYPPNPVKSVTSAFAGQTVWVESQGEDRYRRAIYTYLKRSSPHPLFETFDMATREVCNMRRIRTNTPLQSFMTLNDRTFIEAAQSLAAKMLRHSEDPEQQIKQGLELALVRPGSPDQVGTLVELYAKMQASYRAAPEDANEMIDAVTYFGIDEETKKSKSAELAALTVVANVILNLDAFLTK